MFDTHDLPEVDALKRIWCAAPVEQRDWALGLAARIEPYTDILGVVNNAATLIYFAQVSLTDDQDLFPLLDAPNPKPVWRAERGLS